MTQRQSDEIGSTSPSVSVVMANWRGERYLQQAIASVLAQSEAHLELLVADDASDDRSEEVVRDAMRLDARVRLLPASRNAGPSDARNRALSAARGEWIAIMDSDDLMHPRRLELLLSAARRLDVDMVADDLAYFGDGPGLGGRTLLGSLGLTDALHVTPELLVRSDVEPRLPRFGYLKPIIRSSALRGMTYDTRLRVGEDFDLYLRLVLQGVRFALLPLPLYLYRRHSASLSHRLSVSALEAILEAQENLEQRLGGDALALRGAFHVRRRSLARGLRYERLVESIKRKKVRQGLGLLLRDPALVGNLVRSVSERFGRSGPRASEPALSNPLVVIAPQGLGTPTVQRPADVAIDAIRIQSDDFSTASRLHALSVQLTDLAARTEPDVVAVGPEGLDTIALLPSWRSAELWLTEADARILEPSIPAGVVLRRI